MPLSYSSSTESLAEDTTKHTIGTLSDEVKCTSDWITGLAVSGNNLFASGYDGNGVILSGKQGRVTGTLRCGSAALCVAHFGGRILTGDTNGNLKIWGHDNTLIKSLHLCDSGIKSIATWDGLAYATAGKAVFCVNINTCESEYTIQTSYSNNVIITEAAVLYTGGDAMSIKSYSTDGSKLRPMKSFKGMSSSVFSLAASKTILAAGGYDGYIKAWNLVTGAYFLSLKSHSSFVSGLQFASSGLELWSGSGDGYVKAWEVNSGSCSLIIDTASEITSIQLSEYSGKVHTANRSGTVKTFFIRNSVSGSSVSDFTPLQCTQTCKKIAEQEHAEVQAAFQTQLAAMQDSCLAKLDVLKAEKDEVAFENKRLHAVIKNLLIENQRLQNSGTLAVEVREGMALSDTEEERLASLNDEGLY
eukprot:TRINITY_DN3053_c1_g4_i1.p1 TRINITY_DN3053_c1_g4~~TRINITY_DN3053_c1_g4_i1.p1  ORF type:complete len:443 (+),score=64.88 TRINITY_DN3053_c1_g4_i1:83-1330(+)